MFLKKISITESCGIFFSASDRRVSAQLCGELSKPPPDSPAREILDKSGHWLVSGIQRLNLHQLVYLTKLCQLYPAASAEERAQLAVEIERFIAETNLRNSPEVKSALLLIPQKIIAAHQKQNLRTIIETVNDYRQIFEQPRYVRAFLAAEPFRPLSLDSAQSDFVRLKQTGAKPAGRWQTWRRFYRNLNPVLRDPIRAVASAGLAAGVFALFPAIAYPSLDFLPFPLSNVIVLNTALGLFTNSVMLLVSANGLRFWRYNLRDLKGVKLSQSAMYSSLGLPLTQLCSFTAQAWLTAAGASRSLLKILTLLGVGTIGAAYTFGNNKIRGKTRRECWFNAFRPLTGSGLSMILTSALNIEMRYLTVVSKACDNFYRLCVEGALNYLSHKAFIRKNLCRLYPQNYGAETPDSLDAKLIKFNIEALSFIKTPGGASSVQGYLYTLDVRMLIRLFQKTGQDRSRHLADIQRYSYADSRQAENYFSQTYYWYRLMLAKALRRTIRSSWRLGGQSRQTPLSSQKVLTEARHRIKNLTAANSRELRGRVVEQALAAIQSKSAGQLNAVLLELYLIFGARVMPDIQDYLAVLTEEQLLLGSADYLQKPRVPAELKAVRKILLAYADRLVGNARGAQARDIIYQGRP
ncbi:MAG: hypothetical protein LBJ25_00380 [Candidatus Margulisbacteria bacterium]|nr:hypothetical protein [Candidatus Margulisiibacteriota bacterium]